MRLHGIVVLSKMVKNVKVIRIITSKDIRRLQKRMKDIDYKLVNIFYVEPEEMKEAYNFLMSNLRKYNISREWFIEDCLKELKNLPIDYHKLTYIDGKLKWKKNHTQM
jgi:hypothetical protein